MANDASGGQGLPSTNPTSASRETTVHETFPSSLLVARICSPFTTVVLCTVKADRWLASRRPTYPGARKSAPSSHSCTGLKRSNIDSPSAVKAVLKFPLHFPFYSIHPLGFFLSFFDIPCQEKQFIESGHRKNKEKLNW